MVKPNRFIMKNLKWIVATKAWLDKHDQSILGCDVNIDHYNERISHYRKMTTLEQRERKAKIDLKINIMESLRKEEAKND